LCCQVFKAVRGGAMASHLVLVLSEVSSRRWMGG
jgi:hypothetical protein